MCESRRSPSEMEEEKSENLSTDAFPTDEVIKNAVFEWLENVDASTVTKKDLKNQLEAGHGWNLDSKKSLLGDALMEFYEKKMSAEVEEEEVDETGEDGNENENNEEDEDNEDEETSQPAVKSRKKLRNSGFQAPVQLSTPLSEFFDGVIFLRRSEVTQKIWAYIRENNLQNPKNRREIFCDQKLEELFGRKKVDMFRMTKLLSANMKSVSELQSGPLPTADEDDDEEDEEEEEEEEVKPTKRRRITKVEKQGSAREHLRREATQQKEKETKKKKAVTKKAKAAAKVATDGDEPPKEKRKSALTKPVELSEKLREFLGYRVVPRTTVTKLVWKYIKEKDLQDPENRKNILCDAEMERVFEKKQFTMFEMNKYLSQMMSPTSLPSDYPSEE